MENKFTILYVDDEPSNLQIFKNTFRREYNVLTAISAKDGLDILQNERVDLILTDQRMPEMDGVTFLKRAIQNYPDLNRILITAFSDFDALRTAINEAQIFQYIQKPWREDELRTVIERALEIYHLKKENELLNEQLKEQNILLEKINDDLLAFEKLKLEFLSTISHEIRTPLNGLVGTLELLNHGAIINDTKSIQDIYFMLETSIRKLERFLLSAELITFLKAKKYPIKVQKVDIKLVLNKVLAKLEDKITSKKIDIISTIESSIFVEADENLLSIVFRNIIENTIKYSPDTGKIFINHNQQSDSLQIEFIDQGKGFPENVLKNAFQLFNKGCDNLENQVGLNLSLSNMIMEELLGEIKISNAKNAGASVQLTLKK
ncbi:hypothetical protein CYCD_11070 [Tenuifilaceae bacterium CYCD]|nr:hypothetical protein CYCD_11070 [Tenuifilaceae bacterium CYCD]